MTETVNEKVTENAEQFDPNDKKNWPVLKPDEKYSEFKDWRGIPIVQKCSFEELQDKDFDPNDKKNWPVLKPGERYSEFKDWRGIPIVQKCPFEEVQDKDFDPNDKKNWPKLRPGDKYSEFKDWRGVPIVQRGPISLYYVALQTLNQFLIAIGECIALDLKDDPEAERGIQKKYIDLYGQDAVSNENDCLAKDWKDKYLGEDTVIEVDEYTCSFRIMESKDVDKDYYDIQSYDSYRFEFIDYEGMMEEAKEKSEKEKEGIIEF